MHVTHPLTFIERGEFEERLHVIEQHEELLRQTNDYADHESEVVIGFVLMRRVVELALADEPIDRCLLDECIEVSLKVGVWRKEDDGYDRFAEDREKWIELVTKLTTLTTEADDDPVDRDEVEALLWENEELWKEYGPLLPQHMGVTLIAVSAVMRQWLEDPNELAIGDMLSAEALLRSNHVYWMQNFGEDPNLGARQQRLTLFRRMRRQLQNGRVPAPATQDERLLTLEETAVALRKSTRTVRRWAHDGILSGLKVGSTWRFAKRDVERMKKGDLNGLAPGAPGLREDPEGRVDIRGGPVRRPLSVVRSRPEADEERGDLQA